MTAALLERAGSTTTDAFGLLVADLASPPSFASALDVTLTGALLAESVGLVGRRYRPTESGQRYHFALSPGTVSLRVRSVQDLELVREDDDTGSDDLEETLGFASARAGRVRDLTLFDLEERGRTITEFSRAARRRMTRKIAELDYSRWHEDGGVLGMVTLTLPGWWEVVAPSGQVFKRHVRVLRERWIREVGSPWRGLWKLEFQRRGAPHLHALMRVPSLVGRLAFEDWLSLTWAEICADSLSPRDRAAYDALGESDRHVSAGTGIDFSGSKFSDPRRTAIYFLKHSSKTMDDKEYQHVVPALWQDPECGPGRFWGYWGLCPATAEFEVTRAEFVRARRILRHVARARAASAEINRRRSTADAVCAASAHCTCGDRRTCELWRWTAGLFDMDRVQARAGFGAKGGGWVLVNDGLSLAWDVGRALALP